jgi:serine/threonine-protein kinase
MTESTFSVKDPGALKRFGRYRLLYRFATGGMANIYVGRLRGAEGFEKLVAVKAIHEHLTDNEEFVKMFIDEARLASRITHPNVAQTLELGRVDETHFIAMEYVDGESINSLLRRTGPPMAVAARIVADAAAGLHAAHELKDQDGQPLGVVHRDVSPHNILVSYDGAVKVVDFGVARARGSLHTTTGEIKGKFGYMAPEQLIAPKTVDRRADIFSLGVVLHEITTRRRLIKAPTEGEQISMIMACKFPCPSKYGPYPEDLERIVMRALSKDPKKRFETAHELQVALERFIVSQGGPVLQAAVGEMMSTLFADRIEEKRRVLERCERDDSLDIYDADLVSQYSKFMSQYGTMPGARRRWPLAAIIGGATLVLLVPLVILIVLQLRKPDATARPTGVEPKARMIHTKTKKAVPVSKPDSHPRRQVAKISISISASPENATILFGGKPVENPFRLQRPASNGEVDVVVSAPRHEDHRLTVPLAKGGAWAVVLKPERVSRRGTSGRTRRGTKKQMKDEDVMFNPYKTKKR